ncbi:hypothetical protein [Prochlorococcus sp. MIT 1300]|uniref:tetratricopeptide repeat protein n=1 Tax=Prochlorococcus sp. MIT 1300 TaxID=3096218 RepID=UPI002A747CA5|nr:hypothetical protein [Prochlorococcus sp. MIT 1300]
MVSALSFVSISQPKLITSSIIFISIYESTLSRTAKAQTSEEYLENGIIKGKNGNSKEAILDFDNSIRLDSRNISAYINRGIAKKNLADFSGALSDFNKAIKLSSDSPYLKSVAYHKRGHLYLTKKKFKKALQDFDQAIKNHSSNTTYFSSRAFLKAEHLKEYKSALNDWSKAIILSPKDERLYNNRGYTKKILGDPQGACNDFQISLSIKDNPQAKQWISGKGDSYCEPYVTANESIPDQLSKEVSEESEKSFMEFLVDNKCLEEGSYITSNQAKFRRLNRKDNPSYSYLRLSRLDYNYLTKSVASKEKLASLISKAGGCNKIITELKNKFNGKKDILDYDRGYFYNITWEKALENAISLPYTQLSNNYRIHPNISPEKSLTLQKELASIDPNKWGKRLTVKNSTEGIKRKKNMLLQPTELCTPMPWVGYPTRRRKLDCIQVFKGKDDLRLVEFSRNTEKINPKSEPKVDFTFVKLIDCKRSQPYSIVISFNGKPSLLSQDKGGYWSTRPLRGRYRGACKSFH